METDERVAALRTSVERFADVVAGLPEPLFLRDVGGRTPRDIVAHLIGWNWNTIEGDEQHRRGEVPAYLVDPGEDFSTVNAAAMRRYASRDRDELLGQLRDSLAALEAYLGALPPADARSAGGHPGPRLRPSLSGDRRLARARRRAAALKEPAMLHRSPPTTHISLRP